jgi:hypothetical protein
VECRLTAFELALFRSEGRHGQGVKRLTKVGVGDQVWGPVWVGGSSCEDEKLWGGVRPMLQDYRVHV